MTLLICTCYANLTEIKVEFSIYYTGCSIFERELVRLAAVQVKSLGKPEEEEEEGTFTKVLIVLLGKLAMVQVESLGKLEEEE